MRRSRNRVITSLVMAAVLLAVLFMSSCGGDESEADVRSDLEIFRSSQFNAEDYKDMLDGLSEEGREHFRGFMGKASEFEYEFAGAGGGADSGSSADSDLDAGGSAGTDAGGDEDSRVVRVRIRTYNFGIAYLEAWTDYLEDKGNDKLDENEFYELLMEQLSGLEEKNYYKDVDIVCTDPDGDGVWKTDVSSNRALRDAVFGGMLTEMAIIGGIE